MTKRHLAPVVLVAATLVAGVIGIQWGLPSTDRRELMLPGATADQLQAIARAGATVGAPGQPDTITADAARLKTYFRTLLYSFNPDEYLGLKALAGLRHGDPGVYRYGGAFLAGEGLVLGVGRLAGAIELRGDAVYYLEHPEAMGRMYVAGRLFVVAMTALGVLAAWRLGRLLAGEAGGVMAGLLVLVLPATVNWMHVAKPHLAACGLVLLAAEMAVRYLCGDGIAWRRLAWSAALIGLGAGMALSIVPALLLPVTAVAMREWRCPSRAIGLLTVVGTVFAAVVLVTNPWYVTHLGAVRAEASAISADVGARYGAGGIAAVLAGLRGFFLRQIPLAMSWPLAAMAAVAAFALVARSREARMFLPAVVAASILAAWTVGASLEPNAARFALVPVWLLAVGLGAAMGWLMKRRGPATYWVAPLVVLVGLVFSMPYLAVYQFDSRPDNSRNRAAAELTAMLGLNREDGSLITVGTILPPAAYSFPPLPLSHVTPVALPEVRRPDGELPDYLLLDSSVRRRRPSGWWWGDYEPVVELPTPIVDRTIGWDTAPMSTADYEFLLLRRKH